MVFFKNQWITERALKSALSPSPKGRYNREKKEGGDISLFLSKRDPTWVKKSEKEILDLKLKELYVPLENTGLQPYLDRLLEELEIKGLSQFKPYFWFSEEWFTPDGHTGIAIPFYLAHKKLAKIQEKHLYDVEGGTPSSFMRLLRHECGHAIDNAFQLRRRKNRQKIFGKSSLRYDDFYVPKPFSKQFVNHLGGWYSQSHPDEDFAETFAVWLDPRSRWKRRYKEWKGAYNKLLYMDSLMKELSETKPLLSTRKKIENQTTINKRLKDHIQEKRDHYGVDYPDVYDVYLFKIFTNNPNLGLKVKASTFIRKIKKDVRKSVSPWTGAYQYTINQVIQEVVERCSELSLRLRFSEEETKNQFISMLSVITLEYIHSGHHKIAR